MDPEPGRTRPLTRSGPGILASTGGGLGSRSRGITLVAAAGILWSTLGLGVRLMDSAGPWRILFYRSIVQILVVGAMVAARNPRGFVRAFARIGSNGLMGAASLAFSSCCMVYALTLATVAEVTLILGAAPVLAGLLAWLLMREPVIRTTWLTMGMALGGVAVMTSTGGATGSLRGTVLAFGAALGFAAFTVFQRRGKQVDMLPSVAVAGVLILVATGWLIDGGGLSGLDLVVAFYLGGVALAGGLALYTAGSRYLRSAELILICMTEVVFAPIWVWWAFGETVAGTTIIGGAIILAAVVIQARAGSPWNAPTALPTRRTRWRRPRSGPTRSAGSLPYPQTRARPSSPRRPKPGSKAI